VKRLLYAALLLAASGAQALSSEAREFIAISKELEPVQCEKRKLRREIVLAEAEHRETKELRLRRSRDPQDLEAISHASREAFYRCE
jgi:hypothetical protein